VTYYRRRDMTDAEWALAGALGVAVGAATFYLARIWMQREPLSKGPPGLAGLEDEPEGELEAGGAEAEHEVAEPDVESEAEGAERPPR
jgi:hypothetical protein